MTWTNVLATHTLMIIHIIFCSGPSVAVYFLGGIEALFRLFCLLERDRTTALLFCSPVAVTKLRNGAANTTHRADLDLNSVVLFRSSHRTHSLRADHNKRSDLTTLALL